MRNHFPVVPRIIQNRGGIREIIYSHKIKFRLTYAQSYTPIEVVFCSRNDHATTNLFERY